MGRSILILFIVSVTMIIIACSDNNPLVSDFSQSGQETSALSKKPSSSLNCTMTYDFVGGLGIFDAEGRLLAWDGEIHGDIEGRILYWMVVKNEVGPPNMPPTAPLNFFEARFEIFVDGTLILAGESEGKTLTTKGKEDGIWRGNGLVTETKAEFGDWISRNVSDGGNVIWTDSPFSGEGKFRIN